MTSSWQSAKFHELTSRFPLFAIKSDTHLEAALEVAREFFQKESLDADELLYLESLNTFIALYEKTRYSSDFSHRSPQQALRDLMAVDGLKPFDLTALLGVSLTTANEICAGKLELSKTQIVLLSRHFGVSTDTFMGPIPPSIPAHFGKSPQRIIDFEWVVGSYSKDYTMGTAATYQQVPDLTPDPYHFNVPREHPAGLRNYDLGIEQKRRSLEPLLSKHS